MSPARDTEADIIEHGESVLALFRERRCSPGRSTVMERTGLSQRRSQAVIEWARRRFHAGGTTAADSARHDRLDTLTTEPKPPEAMEQSIDEVLDYRCSRFKARTARADSRKVHRVKISTPGPFAVVHFGDPHVDDIDCNLPLLRRHLQIVNDTEGMYAGNVGDVRNNWIGRLARLWAHTDVTEHESWRLARWIFETPHLYAILGNHDHWQDSTYMRHIIAEAGIPVVADHEARIEVQGPTGDPLRLVIRHFFKGNSQWNPAHGAMKRGQFDPWGDAYIQGHTHTMMGAQTPGWDGKLRSFAVVRGYKWHDEYADQLGFSQHEVGAAVATIYDPDATTEEGRLTLCWDIEQAADLLTWMRGRRAVA